MAQGQPTPPLQGYIQFEDPIVGDICKNTFGDGIGLTYEQAALVTSDDLMGVFEGDSSIVSFKELKYFTGLEYIPEYCFNYCESLEAVELPSSIIEIRESAFEGCGALEDITFPPMLQIIGESAFMDCISLQNLRLPDTVAKIWDNAFCGCVNVQSLVLPRNEYFNEIWYSAFANCNLTNLVIPSNVKVIYQGAFADNINLTQVRFEDGTKLEAIQERAFTGSLLNEGSCVVVYFDFKGDFETIPTIEEYVFSDEYGDTPIIYIGKGEDFGYDLDILQLFRSKSGSFWYRYNLAPLYNYEHN